MWNFARTQTRSSQRSEIETPVDRNFGQIFGNMFEPLEPPTPRRECVESPAATMVVPTDADNEVQFEESEELTENAA